MNLDSRLIFVRTEKGEDELRSRTHGLALRLRHVLILVNGQASVQDILIKGDGLPDIPGSLTELAQSGFIKTTTELLRSAQASRDPKVELVQLAQKLLGNQSLKVVQKIERTQNTPDELAKTAEQCKKLIKLLIDDQNADEFGRRAQEIIFASTVRAA